MTCRILSTCLVLAMLPGCTAMNVSSDCDRACLQTLADSYLAALADNDPGAVPLSGDLAFVENITPLQPGEGLWATTVDVSDLYRISVLDPDQGSIGLMTIIERRTAEGVAPALLAVRLQIRDGQITEAEHLVDEVPPIADPNRLIRPRPDLVRDVPESRRIPRAGLARIATGYYEALDRSDASLGAFAADCERQENGMITAAYYLEPEVFDQVDVNGNPPPPVARDCIGQMNSRRFAYIDSIDNRRLVAIDPVRGLVMGFSHFRQSMANGPHRMVAADGSEVMWEERRDPYDLPAAHIFKITDGEIHEVEAIGIFVPYDSPSGWE